MSSNGRIRKFLIPFFLIAIIAVSTLALQQICNSSSGSQALAINSNPYIGIAFCGNTTSEAKMLIDKAKNYTNLFVLDTGRSELSRNETSVIEICDYATANDLSVIINLGINSVTEDDVTAWFWDQKLTDLKQNWTQRWGDKFLGIYYNDEPGGIQLDGSWTEFYQRFGGKLTNIDHPAMVALNDIQTKLEAYVNNGTKPENYDLEAAFFVNLVLNEGDPGLSALNAAEITTFTSDYGLYWWDFLGGYNVMFAELGWNASIAQQIAQVKGAARLQEKDWGAMITWKYYDVPFLDSGEEIYKQMLTAYQSGAKYIMIFNYAKDDKGNTAAAMTDEHFLAIERFWNDTHNTDYADLSTPEAALVLPHNYGWGMRDHYDNIWGFWPTDEKTQQIATVMGHLLSKYGASLDIVFEDLAYPTANVEYKNVYYWNSTDV